MSERKSSHNSNEEEIKNLKNEIQVANNTTDQIIMNKIVSPERKNTSDKVETVDNIESK